MAQGAFQLAAVDIPAEFADDAIAGGSTHRRTARGGIRTGERIRLVSPDEAAEHRWAGVARTTRSNRIVGTPDQAVDRLDELAARTGADELMISTVCHATATRVASLELLAEAWGAGADLHAVSSAG